MHRLFNTLFLMLLIVSIIRYILLFIKKKYEI